MTASPETDGRTRRAAALREQRRALILDAAVRVFSASGYHQTRISDIIAEAGIARGTFYLYFESKNAIFHELLDDLLADLRASVVGVRGGPDAPPMLEQLHQTVARLLSRVADQRELTTILIREAVGLDEEIDQKLTGFYDNLHLLLKTSLKAGQALGVVRDLDVEIAATCVLGALRQVLERYLVRHDAEGFDVDRVAGAILDTTLAGLSPR